jgi:hypothetical protein
MSAFEFIFSLFGLLLGLSLAEVLGGLARTIKRRRLLRRGGAARWRELGWLTPLLGLFVMLDVTSFWDAAWGLRDSIPPRFASLVAALAVAGLYYLAASLVFPDGDEEAGDASLDDHYLAHKEAVLGGILLSKLPLLILVGEITAWWHRNPAVIAVQAVYFAIALTAIFSKRRWVNGAALGGLILLYGAALFVG